MTYNDVLLAARKNIGPYCKACPECNGRACGNKIPGPGAKGYGDTAIRNYTKWKDVRINMDTISENLEIDTSIHLFNNKFKIPLFAGPVGAVKMHYGNLYTDVEYNNILVKACAENGIAAFTGDGLDSNVLIGATSAIAKSGGIGIPTIKPWDAETISEKIGYAKKAGAMAVAMDIDAAGLPFLKNRVPAAGRKSTDELRDIINSTDLPFIIKGIMTPEAALKAEKAGAYGIVVSNHGGRVLDGCPSTAEVLPEIAHVLNKRIKIFVDGGIRSGLDIFKAIALGADAVLIARPFVTATYGAQEEGISLLINKLANELEDVMMMTGAGKIEDISKKMIW